MQYFHTKFTRFAFLFMTLEYSLRLEFASRFSRNNVIVSLKMFNKINKILTFLRYIKTIKHSKGRGSQSHLTTPTPSHGYETLLYNYQQILFSYVLKSSFHIRIFHSKCLENHRSYLYLTNL